MKQRFYGFKMHDNKSIDENLDDFTKLVSDLKTMDIKVEDEDQTIFFLNSLPKAYDQLRDTLKYGKTSLTLDEVIIATYSKELDLKTSGKSTRLNGEMLNVRGRSEKRDSHNNQGKSKSKSRSKSRTKKTCWYCHKEGHIRRFCPQRKNTTQKKESNRSVDAANMSQDYESSEVLIVSSNPREEWIMDSGCTFSMTPRKEQFIDHRELNEEKVLMGNNNSCKVVGVGSVRIKLHDGSVKTLMMLEIFLTSKGTLFLLKF